MNNNRIIQLTWLIAVAVLVTGLVMTIGNFRAISEHGISFESKLKTYAELKQMDDRMERYNGAVKEFQKLQSKRAVSLKDALKNSFPEYRADNMRETRKESVAGWFVRDSEIVLNGVKVSQVMDFVAGVEKLRPPWVLKKFSITASSGEEGAGDVIMTLSGLSQSD